MRLSVHAAWNLFEEEEEEEEDLSLVELFPPPVGAQPAE